ncbi:Ig-like domain-containing protein, partial [Microcoleus sp. D2B6]|uniref:Ig-like domain-containing protein n=2 Tax=unclassified Microcoleus TaxID=2642155 RepID=UPI002FD3B80D
ADPNGNSSSGQSYVVFGKSTGFSATLDLSTLNGTNGFILNGIAAYDNSGISVSSAGDVNGDGIDDLIIGANGADPNGNSSSGQSYVVFGKSTGFSATLDLSTLNGTNGFTINGIAASDNSGLSVSSAGDVNGDGIDDLIIGAFGASPNGPGSGQSYVVFGKSTGFSATLDLSTLNGTNGFAINGFVAPGFSGISVSSAGDVNGDGFDDLIIGSSRITSNSNISSGQSYLVFGKSTGFSATLDLSTLNGTNGFILNGIAAFDLSGNPVSSAGDVNGDGIDDLIIGAFGADPNGSYSGQSNVVFGNRAAVLDLNGTNGSGIDFSTTFTSTPVSIVDSDFTLTDNNATLAGATIAITNLLDGTAESLAATATGNITASYNATTGTLTLSGTDTVANYRQVLASLTYNNTATSPNTTNRTIEFVVDDGQAFSNTSAVATTTLAFNLNQPPVGFNDSATTAKNTAVSIQVSTLLANDTDPDSNPLSITGVSNATNGSAVLNDNGTPGNTADDFIVFTPTTGFSGNGSFDYTLSDGSLTDTGNVTVAVGNNFSGGNGDDLLNGTAGNDNLSGGNGKDTLNGNGGNDTLAGGNGGDILNGGDGNDLLQGDDSEESSNAKDILTGGAGNDALYGGNGKDDLTGGTGNDILTGGNGSDTFIFAASDGTDTITDFNDGLDYIGLSGGLTFGQLSFSGSNIIVTSTTEILATLTGINTTTLTSADFLTV